MPLAMDLCEKVKMTEPYVTDHALLRYLERVMGIDVERIREEMISEAMRIGVEFGASAVKLGTGERMVLQGSTIVTVLPKRGYRHGD